MVNRGLYCFQIQLIELNHNFDDDVRVVQVLEDWPLLTSVVACQVQVDQGATFLGNAQSFKF